MSLPCLPQGLHELMEDLLSLMVCLVPDEEFNLDYSTLTSLLARNIQAIIKLYINCFYISLLRLLYPIQCKLYIGRSAISVGHIVLKL